MKNDLKMRILPLLMSLLMCFALSACGAADEENMTDLQKGMSAIENGDYETAETSLLNALRQEENLKAVYRGLGMAKLAQGNVSEAIGYFEDALSQSNGIIEDMDIDISYYLAVAQYRQGNTEDAIATYNAIIDIRPNEDNAYYMRGKAYLLTGHRDQAISDYEKAVELAPGDYDHYLRICEDLREAGYQEDGDSYIRRAMESGNKLSDYQLGVFNYYLGNYTDARGYLENAKNGKKVPENLIVYLGRTYEALGDVAYAISMYEEYITAGGENAAAYVYLGLAKMGQNDYSGAIEVFDAGIATGDSGYMQSMMYNRIVSYEYLKNWNKAKELMAEYVKKYPDDEKAARENIFLSTR